MSQSELHNQLIRQVEIVLRERFHDVELITDIQQVPGDEIPPLIGQYRPDIYGCAKHGQLVFIAEAKTDGDINNQHTEKQIREFLRHMESAQRGFFVLSVSAHMSDIAKTFMRFLCMEVNTENIDVTIFDEFFLWRLDNEDKKVWHMY